MKHTVRSVLFVATLLSATAAAQSGPPGMGCTPGWQPTFGNFPGVLGGVSAMAVHDDGGGAGAALYVGGGFSHPGLPDQPHLARWDGADWSTLGPGQRLDGGVFALAVYDDGSGSGPALFAGGTFTTAGGTPAGRIAKWDGSSWSPLDQGTDATVRDMEVFDDGTGGGPALYVAGSFTTAGGLSASRIARWDGSTWSLVGNGGSDDRIDALAVYDDGLGAGPALHAAGSFDTIGGVVANGIARWDGASWSPLGAGLTGDVETLEVFDDGAGPALYAGGYVDSAGGLPVNHVARWDGQGWEGLGSGTNLTVRALAVFEDGSGPALYAGGSFTGAGGATAWSIARWDGASWSAVGSGTSSPVLVIEPFDLDDGQGERLAVGGSFHRAGEVTPVYNAAVWDGGSWSAMGRAPNERVEALATLDDGSGAALYVGGAFTHGQGRLLNHVARWDGETLEPFGSGVDNPVCALTVFDDGSGAALYAGGHFTSAGGVDASFIARWDGAAWSALDGGLDAPVRALAVHDDGTGPALYAGGEFTQAGDVAANRVARWDGASWSAVGDGMDDTVLALTVYRAELYAGGEFSQAGSVPALHVARWDGGTWRELGTGTSDTVRCLEVFDEGTGNGRALYAGGDFTSAGGLDANHVARWDGASWSEMGAGFDVRVNDLVVHDDGLGGGPALHAGGGAGGAVLLARWDGASWTSLAWGTDGPVLALGSFADASGRSLYAGGSFRDSGAGDAFLARRGCPAPLGEVYCPCDGSGAPSPCGNAGGAGEGCVNSTGTGAALTASGSASVAADDLALYASGLIPGQPALLFVGDAAVNGGDGIAFGDGLRCAGGTVRRLGVEPSDAGGMASWGPGLSGPGALTPGTTARFQVWYRDPGASPCGQGFNLTNGVAVELAR